MRKLFLFAWFAAVAWGQGWQGPGSSQRAKGRAWDSTVESPTSGCIINWNSGSAVYQCTGVLPSGAVVGTTDTQTLTNKTLGAGTVLPNPAVAAKGGVEALTCSGSDKISAIGTNGIPVCSADQTGGVSPVSQAFSAGATSGTLTHNFGNATHIEKCYDANGEVTGYGVTLGTNADTYTFTGGLAGNTTCYAVINGGGGGSSGVEIQDSGGAVIGTFTKLRFGNGNVSWNLADLGLGLARATPNLVGYGGQAFMVNPGAATLAGSQTLYGSPSAGSLNSNRDVRDVASPFACTLRDLFVRIASSQSGTGTLVVTLQVNGVDTPIVATIAAGAAPFATATDVVNTASVNQFDRVVAKYVNNASATSAQIIQTSWRCN